MEILSPKLNSFGSLSKTTKAVSSKVAYPFDQNSNYNKENVIDSMRKEKNSIRAEENSNYQTRARSLERRNQNQLQGSYSYNRTEHTGNSSSLAAQFGNFFNSPKNVDGDFFKNQVQEKDSYRAKHLSRGLKTSFSKPDEKSSQSISNDQYLQSKIDQIINSSLSIKERSSKNTSSAAKPHSSTTNFEERSSEKLTLYTRLLNDMRTATPKSKELVNQDQQYGSSSSKHSTMNASSEYYSRNNANVEAKKPYLDLKLSSVDFDSNVKGDPKTTKSHQRLSFSQKRVERSEENIKPERVDQQQDLRKSGTDYQKQERLSLSRTLTVNTQNVASEPQFIKHPVTTKNPKGGLRHNDNQGIYESLSNLKKSLERPLNSSIHKSSQMPSYNNFFGNEPKEAKEHREQRESRDMRESTKDSKAIFKSATPKANTVTSSEVKNILQSFRNVLQKESTPHSSSKNQLTGGDEKQNSSMNKRTLDDEAYQNYLKEGAHRNEEKQTSSYHQRPPSSSKSSKYRESSLNLNRRPEEKLSTSHSSQNTEKEKPPQRSLKDFITQVNSTDSLPIKTKLDLNVPGNERQSFSNLQGHPHSTKNSVPRPNNTNDKFLSISNTNTGNVGNMGKAASTTTNSSVAQESKSFSFNSSLINKHSSRTAANMVEEKNVPAASVKKEVQKVAAAICQYYMAGIDRYLRNNVNFETDYFAKIYKEHFLQGYQAINFCKYLKAVDPAELAKKKVYLPKKESHKDKKTIIFDLDETLIHCNENANIPSDVVLPIRFPHGDIIEAGINVRPYAIEALEELSKHFEIIVFTASHSCYANVVLDHLDPHNKYIHHRLFRESCVTTEEGLYIKDLRIFANRNLKDMVIVDNAMYSFGYQFENGIPIIPFYYHKADKELKTLVPYLKSLYHVRDVRDVNIKSFKLHSFAQHDSHEELLRRLFE